MKNYKAIIFDLDGTLIDSMPYHFLAFKETLKEHGVSMGDATLKHFMGSSTKKILQNIKNVYPFEGNVDDIREERRYHYFKALKRKNIIFPSVEKMIKSLKKNYKVAIATGSSRVTTRYSVSKRFMNLFDTIVTINDVRREKPYPDQLLLVARRLKISPQECLMVGDSSFDVLSANRAKMDCFGVLTGFTSKKELVNAGAKNVFSSILGIHKYLNKNFSKC